MRMSASASPAAAVRSVVAVNDVSLEVAAGRFLAIVGGSGSGKTTLLRLANRLIERNGHVAIEGKECSSVDPGHAAPRHRLCVPERQPVRT